MGAVSRFRREGLSRFDRDVVREWGSVPESQPRLQPIKYPAPVVPIAEKAASEAKKTSCAPAA
jgi:hypothetical protein